MTTTLSPVAVLALKACLSTRGPSKGLLLKTAPSPFYSATAYAAWQGAMMVCNPYKVSIMGQMLMKPNEREVYEEVLAFFEEHPELKHLDRDRSALERLGVW